MIAREGILEMFRKSGAFLEGHFQLTSGLHSPHYFQCAKVLQYPENTARLCAGIVGRHAAHAPQVVIAPALGGIVVGQEVGRQLNVRTMFTERKEGTMQLRRGFAVSPGERVLVCEDVVTTGGSVKEVIGIVLGMGGLVTGVGAIVDRSGGKSGLENFYAPLVMDAVAYPPDSCPLCAKGLPVEKPGSRAAR
jgi:orotate phosphoribosyltransferase